MLRRSLATPMRTQLLKKQLRAEEPNPVISPILQQTIYASAMPSPRGLPVSDIEEEIFGSPILANNAPAVATTVEEANARYDAEFETRENRDADARAVAERSYHTRVETIDNDLSIHHDASHKDSVTPPHTPSPSPTRKRNVRWSYQRTVKTYYVDERISEMLDSTLEAIRSPMSEPIDDEDVYDDDYEGIEEFSLDGLDFDEDNEGSEESTQDDSDSDFDEDVDGPPLDDSLEESQLSKELLQDLEDDFKSLLSKPPPPPPAPKSIMPALSEAERTQLEDIVIKSKHGLNEAFPIVPHKITARDFGTLLPDQFNGSAKAWLNDEIVNEYLALLVKQWNHDAEFVFQRGGTSPPYHAFSSHWYNSIKGGMKNVERWATRANLGGKKFLDAKIVLYPICDGSHWRLLAVKPQERVIEYLDSLGWNGDKYVEKLNLYLKNELKELYIEEEWTVVEEQRSSRQLNGSDCGVFVLVNAVAVLLGASMQKVVACNGMIQARERIALTIITGNPVELDW